MAIEQLVDGVLDRILVHQKIRIPVKQSLVRNITTQDGSATIEIAASVLEPELQKMLETRLTEQIAGSDGISSVQVNFAEIPAKELNDVGRVIAIMSGKGGVGKSLVTALTGVALRRDGYNVGILDADITGPSIPKMFGVSGHPSGTGIGMLPVASRSSLELMSVNLLLPEEDEAVIWRGPLIARVITQFWEEVLWGNLDYLLVDLPPGTADAPLTVLQNLPVSGIIIVYTPQDLTNMVVRKAVKMAQKMDKPIFGVVENMSYLYIPEIDKKMELFGKSRGMEMAELTNSPLLAQMPIDPELAKLCDEGRIEEYQGPVMDSLRKTLDSALNNKQ